MLTAKSYPHPEAYTYSMYNLARVSLRRCLCRIIVSKCHFI